MLGAMGKRDTELETDAELWARVARERASRSRRTGPARRGKGPKEPVRVSLPRSHRRRRPSLRQKWRRSPTGRAR